MDKKFKIRIITICTTLCDLLPMSSIYGCW